MRILFLTDGIEAPAPRYRCEQFFPYFEAEGIECSMRWAYGPLYNRVFNTNIGPVYKAATRLKRAFATFSFIDDYDLVFLQRTAFPQSAFAEQIARSRGAKLVFDFDDSLWLGPGGVESAVRRKAFNDVVFQSQWLIAGNQFLAKQADHPHKTTIIPTVTDTDRYVPDASNRKGVTIGWMGTAGNFPFLERIVPSLKRVLDTNPDVSYRMVSNASFKPLAGHPQVEQIRWSPDTEIPLLQSFDIGLMPLVDSSLTRGKCAFKMIQYMSVGTPVVVSDVGANREVHEGSGAGFLLESFDWDDALQALIDDAKLRSEMGEAGRQRAVDSYSIHAVLPQYLKIFERLAS